jgi:hypothetical protein
MVQLRGKQLSSYADGGTAIRRRANLQNLIQLCADALYVGVELLGEEGETARLRPKQKM